MDLIDRYCESCLYACPWDYEFEKIMCSKVFKEKEPFDTACEDYIPVKERKREARILTLSKRGNIYDEEEY